VSPPPDRVSTGGRVNTASLNLQTTVAGIKIIGGGNEEGGELGLGLGRKKINEPK
jgi:hypothetical protein